MMIVKNAYDVCKKTLSENMDILESVKDALIEKETITGKEVEEIVKNRKKL